MIIWAGTIAGIGDKCLHEKIYIADACHSNVRREFRKV